MRVTRFCSLNEYHKFISGETLINTTDHYNGGKGGSISVGFCFTEDEPHTAWRYLKGIVYPEICMVLDIDNSLLTPSFGKYGDYSNGQDGTHACLKIEYCLTQYSNRTAKLIQILTQEQFATSPEELLAIRLLMLTNYELGKD